MIIILIVVFFILIKILALNFKVEVKVQKLIDKITTLNPVPIDLHFNNVFPTFYNFVLKYCILILASNKMNKFKKKKS